MPRGDVPKLDRLITLLIPGPSETDSYGHEQPGVPVGRVVWAQRLDASPRDQLDWDNDARLNVNTAIFVIRYRTDVESGRARICDDEGFTRSVIGRALLPRRLRYMALLCERTS